MEDEDGMSYYFRGAVENNYVRFGKFPTTLYRGYDASNAEYYREYSTLQECQGAGKYNSNCGVSPNAGKDMYWRIIRINGTGSIRMIYDGTKPYTNGEVNNDRVAFTGVIFNYYNDDNKYVGYMYGGKEGEASTSKEQAQTNETESNIKKELETWYEKILNKTIYENHLSDEVFCADRSISNASQLGYGANKTIYGSYSRMWPTSIPTLKCDMNNTISNSNDKFTVNPNKGNGKLKYPVGMITADEATLAGSKIWTTNGDFYLTKGIWYWFISASGYENQANAFVIVDGNVGVGTNVNYGDGSVAPVINLSAETFATIKGSGTMTDPYRID